MAADVIPCAAQRNAIAVASIFTGIFIVAASYAECDKLWVVVHFAISVAFQGVPGVAVNALDLSPNYAGVLMGIGGTVSSITGILVPYIVGVATPNVSELFSIRFLIFFTNHYTSLHHAGNISIRTGIADRMARNILDYIRTASDQVGDLLDLGIGRCTAMGYTIRQRQREITIE